VTGASASVPAEAHLRRSCSSHEEAEALLRSLAPDNEGFVRARTEGALLFLDVQAKGVPELRRTLEDTLACLSAAERTWNAARGTTGTRETAPGAARPGPEDEEEDDEGDDERPSTPVNRDRA
jgi:hypothetical protein